ncbi:TPA: hypothetical protein HA249_02115 [Candidatus Woesearchaeota archaeon]|nr:hypothetical protein [Candidatus Woesearchaeota archaeon]HIH47847.1 hypothetical protein [Candidatus Woesearchaeota archaeon]HII88307.1 hypothetical protein [Candidatus Woesearchaeota archaeon]
MTGTSGNGSGNGSGVRSNGTGKLHLAESLFSTDPSMHDVYRDMGSPFTTGGLDDIAGLDTPEDFIGYTTPEGTHNRVARHHLKPHGQDENGIEKRLRKQDQPLGFDDVKRYTHALAQLEQQVDQYLYEEKNDLQKVGHRVQMFVKKVLGKRVYTIDELFAIQLHHALGLKHTLEVLIGEGKEAFQELRGYSRKIEQDAYMGIHAKALKDGELILNNERLKKMDEDVKGTDITSAEYYPKIRDANELSWQIQEEDYAHQLAIQKTENARAELGYLNPLAQLFRLSIYVAEKACTETRKLAESIQNTRTVYRRIQGQQIVTQQLVDHVDVMRKALYQVDSVIQSRLKEMGPVVRKIPANAGFYGHASERTRMLLDTIRTATNEANSHYESRLNQFIAERRGGQDPTPSEPANNVYVRVPGAG